MTGEQQRNVFRMTDHPQEVLLQDMPTISHNYTKDLITSGYLHEFAYLCFRKFNLRTT